MALACASSASREAIRPARATAATNSTQTNRPAATSPHRGENTSRKPRPFTSAEKLDTQNGIRKNRNICQRCSGRPAFNSSATPTMALSPSDVSHSRGLASK